jgi:hypothetical protein
LPLFGVFGRNRTRLATSLWPPILSWNRLPVQSPHPQRLTPIAYANPLRRWPFLGLAVLPPRMSAGSIKNLRAPLLGFRLPPECFSVAPSRDVRRDGSHGPSHELRLPTAHSRLGGPLCAGFAHPLRSALRVWLPSRRLTPPGPAPTVFQADSAPGIRPFGGFSSWKVLPTFPPKMNPHAVQAAVAATSKPAARTDNPRLPGFDPSRNPWPPT